MTKLELFRPMDQQYVCWFKAEKHLHGQTLTFYAGTGNHDCMKDIMDSLKYQAILTRNMMPLVQRLMINGFSCRTAIPKYTSKTYALVQ